MICPTCRKEALFEPNPYRPFCSDRCKLIDLDKWASDTYSVPAESVSPEEFDILEGISPDRASPDESSNDEH